MMEDGSLLMQSTGPKKGSEVWYVFQRTEAWDDIGYTAIPRKLWGTYRAGEQLFDRDTRPAYWKNDSPELTLEP